MVGLEEKSAPEPLQPSAESTEILIEEIEQVAPPPKIVKKPVITEMPKDDQKLLIKSIIEKNLKNQKKNSAA